MLPPGMWTIRVIGQYLRVDGCPQRGTVGFCPFPAAIGQTPAGPGFVLSTQGVTCRIDGDGYVDVTLLHPWSPGLDPGEDEDRTWPYCVTESMDGGATLTWQLRIPRDVPTGAVVNLAKQPRYCETLVRPADWFPHHLCSAPVQAARISP